MEQELATFGVRFSKVLCRECRWPIAREYDTDDGLRIEVQTSRGRTIHGVAVFSGVYEYIRCGQCGTVNRASDKEAHTIRGGHDQAQGADVRQAGS